MESEEDNLICEGLAEVFQPASVFYNPVQEFNRDLTIAVISEFINEHFEHVRKREEKLAKRKSENQSEEVPMKGILGEGSENDDMCVDNLDAEIHYPNGLKILEGLAASGLRSIRFAKEIPGVQSIVTNDFDKNAVAYIDRNIKHNGLSHLVTSSLNDAAMLMYQHKRSPDRFDVVDLDPYGSPSQFLDATVQSVRDGGLLCVTCTDLAVMCGNGAEACYAKYGSMSLKCKFCHEMALRIVLQSIESHANRYGRYIKPLLSVSADFYVRVFVQIFTGQNIVKQSVTKMSMVYHCGGCGSFKLQPMALKTPTKGGNYKYSPASGPPVSERCEHCNSRHHLGGPIWSEPLCDTSFVDRVIKRVEKDPSRFTTANRIIGVLTVITEELQDVPFYYVADDLFSIVHLSVPKLAEIRSAILNAGYKVSLSHAAKNSLKTTAPMSVLWDIIRCWAKKNPVNSKHMKDGTIVKRILSKEPGFEANFECHPDAIPDSKSKGLLRWQANPEKDWGPKPRAKKGDCETLEERRMKGIERAKEKKQSKRKFIDFKQFACKKFKIGDCDLGNDCKYSHQTENVDNEQGEKVTS